VLGKYGLVSSNCMGADADTAAARAAADAAANVVRPERTAFLDTAVRKSPASTISAPTAAYSTASDITAASVDPGSGARQVSETASIETEGTAAIASVPATPSNAAEQQICSVSAATIAPEPRFASASCFLV
jgi:hypothetical protein